MPSNPLFYPLHEQSNPTALRDQVQIALAIADATALKSLLTTSIPPIMPGHLIGEVSAELGVPAKEFHSADAILHFEAIRCRMAAPNDCPVEYQSSAGGWTRESKEFARLTKFESETRTFAEHLTLAPVASLLMNAGFSNEQVQEILHLPKEGWHKSWWHALDPDGHFTLPFLRYVRPLRYPNGKFTIQYKDYFEQDEPPCFSSLPQRVLVSIKPEAQSFSETLRQINHHRDFLKLDRALLICNTISEFEAQAFINQGISIYPAVELVLPSHANCTECARQECLMNGKADSPIALCYGFMPESEYV
jgi:bacterioferritin-associated ferredoxin